jgi:transcriptional regulator with XRE-family HTH domain
VNSSDFARALRDARIEQGIRVNELARRMQVRPSTVCRIEAGQNALLESTVVRYAKALGLEVQIRFVQDSCVEAPAP